MASLMANGRRVNLAIPVLASIYEGLNTIATSPKPAGTSHSFPIHFIYAWLACYFKTHYSVWQELRGPKMTRFSGEGAEPFKFVDDGRAEELDHSYFVAIRSSYLTLRRCGRFIVEPYSPHRFGRQFGYYQDVPGTLRYDTRVASLEEGSATGAYVFYQNLHQKLGSLVCLLMLRNSAWKLIKHGGLKSMGPFFDDNIACLIRPKSIKITLKRKKDEGKQVDGGENDPPHALIPPIVIECDSQAVVVEASKGKCSSHNVADSDSSNKDRHWKRQRKEATPLKAAETNASRSSLANFVAELEDEVQSIDVGEESETSHSSTMTPPLGMGLKRKQSSPPAAGQQLKEVKARLQDVQAKASEEASEIQSVMDELEHVEEDIAVLKGQRTNLRATLKEKKQLNHDTQAKVHEVEKDLAALESTGPLDDAIVQNLESSRANLGILTEDLKSLNPFA
ncbi:UNVERIFIED_CONTAM: hypothetical protein Sradi_6960900 [Sesamum radiatum]|uniref:Aminotransferase-like plant mobile domain-containing protein n=1 Tax=Sesamum radiatum TaxID=300843 RepID=A0AAW2JEG8_SESRA